MTARGQAADSEIPNELADGQTVTTVDMSMDLSMFRATADHVLSTAGYNYGLSPAILTHQGVQSAQARKLMRIPLNEIRRHQQAPLRRFEEQFVVVAAAVVKVDMPSMAFDPAGWGLVFGEEQMALDPVEELNLFTSKRAAGLDNSIDYLKRERPGLTDDEARAQITVNIAVELWRNLQMRPLVAISGSMGAQTPGAPGEAVPPPPSPEREHNSLSAPAPAAAMG